MILVHVAGEVAWDGRNAAPGEYHRIVQPCDRCGIVLREYDTLNPPAGIVMAGQSAPEFGWFGAGDQYAYEGNDQSPYSQEGGGMTWLVSDDETLSSDRYKLCDPDDVPSEIEVFRTIVHD